MKQNDKVTVVLSQELMMLGLGGLEGWVGTVVEVGGFKNGAWVRFPKPFKGELEWYIPKCAIMVNE